MLEPIFRAENAAALPAIADIAGDAEVRARDKALLWRATTLAIEGAFRYGVDMPVGAVAAQAGYLTGRHFASDNRHGYSQLHAEYLAVTDSALHGHLADTVVVTIEPCDNCQDFLAGQSSIKRVAFGLTRQQVAEKGLVKPHAETIFERALRLGLPYQVVQIKDPVLERAGHILLNAAKRDPQTGIVHINRTVLSTQLIGLNAEQ